ncbi:MAG: HD domain-containing protein [Pirellulaceae bacterium]
MTHSIYQIPEVAGLDTCQGMIRIPSQLNVPLTDRVQAIVDSRPFRRLARISQLGLVSLVYPGANHSRFEHSLGVYRMSLLFLRQLSRWPEFNRLVSVELAERFIIAALLHDVGHWPFCHPMEDLQLPQIPRHEDFALKTLEDAEICEILRTRWRVSPEQVVEVLAGTSDNPAIRLLQSLLSGPVDVDKLDYLYRDSLHAGVAYGGNFDQQRLLDSLCLNANSDGVAVTSKGKTAAEMMIFARYVMFSEVYWHHTVRAATAMLQRSVYELSSTVDWPSFFALDEATFVRQLQTAAGDTSVRTLLDGLFGEKRFLYKRIDEFNCLEQPSLYAAIAHSSYPRLVDVSKRLQQQLSNKIQENLPPHAILVDAAPAKLEVECNIQIRSPKTGEYQQLADVSPVVKTLAESQFDHYVKRVRVFVSPLIWDKVNFPPNATRAILWDVIRSMDHSS